MLKGPQRSKEIVLLEVFVLLEPKDVLNATSTTYYYYHYYYY